MLFQLGSIFHIAENAEKFVKIFLTYNGKTQEVTVNADTFASGDSFKSALLTAVSTLADTALSVVLIK